ncbi:hypothetical protein CHCC15136_1712 [Bacillus paralicheniformis]|nr:hypothetical protein CHCC15136_1712 [Bacillus paralicheniformis]
MLNTGFSSNRFCRPPVVPGDHDDFKPHIMQPFHRSLRRVFYRIGDGDQPGKPTVDGGKHRRLSLCFKLLHFAVRLLNVNITAFHQPSCADQNPFFIDCGFDTIAGYRFKAVCGGRFYLSLFNAFDNGFSKRMFRVFFRSTDKLEKRCFIDPWFSAHICELRLSICDSPRLVKHDRLQAVSRLQMFAAFE